MAKYEITRSCGHTETVQIYGPNTRGQREAQAERLAERPCAACRSEANEQLNARAADVAAAAGWPALTGTPKQIAWAQTIRADGIAALAAEAQQQARRAESAGWTKRQAQDLADLLTRIWERAALRQTEARWWIDNRDRIVAAVVDTLADEDRAEHKAGVDRIVAGLGEAEAEQTETSPEEEDEEAVLQHTRMTAQQAQLHDRLVSALREAGERAAAAERARKAALAEIGELLRRDKAAGGLVGTSYAQVLTGLSRPTLIKARADEQAWQELVEVARLAKGSGEEHEVNELHARLPYLAGWWRATDHLLRLHIEAFWAERGGFDPWSTDDPGTPPGYDELMTIYRAQVAAYASGEPAFYRDHVTGWEHR